MMAAKNIQKISLSNKERILNLLKENPENEYTYGDIAEGLSISKTNIGKTINPLAKEGKISIIKRGHKKFVSIESSSSDQSSSDPFSQKENNILKRTPLEQNKKDSLDKSSSIEQSSDQSSSNETHEIQGIPTISDLREPETVNYLKGMKRELELHGRIIPLDKKQKIAIWIFENKADLIDALDTSLKAYKNYKYPKIIRQKKRWREQMKFLEGLL